MTDALVNSQVNWFGNPFDKQRKSKGNPHHSCLSDGDKQVF
jgi:hypothetical protein